MSTRPPPTPFRGTRRLVLVSIVILAAAVGLEGAMRLRQWSRYGTFGRIHAFTADAGSGLAVPVPRRTRRMTVNALAFRGPEIDRVRDAGVVRVAFLGASTTFCAHVSSDAATWPALVVAGLAERFPETRFDYVNAGVAGYTVEVTLENLRWRVAPLEPDLIVILHAANDLMKDTRERAVALGRYAEHGDPESWLGRRSLTWYLLEKNRLLRRRIREARQAPSGEPFDLGALDEGFRARYAVLVNAALEVTPHVSVLTFCPRVRAEQSDAERRIACESAAYYMPYLAPGDILAGLGRYNQAIRAVAAETGALLIELEGAVPADRDHYADSIHFSDAGCRLVAERVLAGWSHLQPGDLAR